MKALLLAALVALPSAPALADPTSTNPYLYTCGDMVAAESAEDRVLANMMLMWSVGYMFGRFGGGPDGLLESEGVDGAISDMVNALNQLCPNNADMSIGVFTQNLGDSLQSSLPQ